MGIDEKNQNLTDVLIQIIREDDWMTASDLATLFQIPLQEISTKIDLIYKEKELNAEVTHRCFLKPKEHGFVYTDHYNSDVIISLAYRIKSPRAKSIRQNFTKILSEYIVKGFALDNERLESP